MEKRHKRKKKEMIYGAGTKGSFHERRGERRQIGETPRLVGKGEVKPGTYVFQSGKGQVRTEEKV